MPHPEFLILSQDSSQLMACDQFGDTGDMLAATEFPVVPQSCFCDEPDQICIDVLADCLHFCFIPSPYSVNGSFIGPPQCEFTSTITLNYPLTNLAFEDVPLAREFRGLWCSGSPAFPCGPPFGAVLGNWTMTSTGSGDCTTSPLINFSNKPLYANFTDANNAGCDPVQLECGIIKSHLKCFNGVTGVTDSFWELDTEVRIGPDLQICTFHRWSPGFLASVCPNSSSVFVIDDNRYPSICSSGPLIRINSHSFSGLNFLN